jgi:hypothetical protein
LLALGFTEGAMREGDALVMFGFRRIAMGEDETASPGSESREPKGANEEETA